MKNFKVVLFFVVIGLILGLTVLAEGIAQYPQYSQDLLNLSSAELQRAGFTDAAEKSVPTKDNIFPNFYFTVKERVSGENDQQWGAASNLVAVFYRPLPLGHGNEINTIGYREYAGRTQAYIYQTNFYLVVTGPDKEKVTSLLKLIFDILS